MRVKKIPYERYCLFMGGAGIIHNWYRTPLGWILGGQKRMRNIKCGVADIRKRVFAEVAKLAYEGGDYTRMEKLPYEIVPGEVGRQRALRVCLRSV